MRTIAAHPLWIPIGPRAMADEKPEPSVEVEVLLPGCRRSPSSAQPEDFLLLPKGAAIQPAGRLVVMVPDGYFDENEFAHRIWGLASTAALPILFLALSTDRETASYLRRRLATIAAVTAFGNVRTSSHILVGKNWPLAVQGVLQPGDLPVCLAGHQVGFQTHSHKALGEILSASLSVPVYLIGELPVDPSPSQLGRIKGIFAWLASFAVIGLFAALQIWIDRSTPQPASTILLCLLVIIEIFILLQANTWIG